MNPRTPSPEKSTNAPSEKITNADILNRIEVMRGEFNEANQRIIVCLQSIENVATRLEDRVVKVENIILKKKEKYNMSTSTPHVQPMPAGGYMELLESEEVNLQGVLQSLDVPLSFEMSDDMPQVDISSAFLPTVTPIPQQISKKRKVNRCSKFIKEELAKRFSEEELANGRLHAGPRKFKNEIQHKDALSPGRLNAILTKAKKNLREDFDDIKDIGEIINSKCRKVCQKVKKRDLANVYD